jgi:hypothetical protein
LIAFVEAAVQIRTEKQGKSPSFSESSVFGSVEIARPGRVESLRRFEQAEWHVTAAGGDFLE